MHPPTPYTLSLSLSEARRQLRVSFFKGNTKVNLHSQALITISSKKKLCVSFDIKNMKNKLPDTEKTGSSQYHQ
jgi:hypothetical protein